MKALTVQQPWAWAIVHGGKDVENRTQAWSYRGPLAIHAGARISGRGAASPLVNGAWLRRYGQADMSGRGLLVTGAIIGVVDLVDVHVARGEQIVQGLRQMHCCDSPWAELGYVEHGGRTRRDIVHLVLANPSPLGTPVECPGALGLWDLDRVPGLRPRLANALLDEVRADA